MDFLTPQAWGWIGFNLFILAMLALDLGVFHKKSHVVSVKEALTWSGVWIALALVFNAGIFFVKGPQAGTEFLTGYLVEKSLSIDNVFVIVLIFAGLKIPSVYQHRVLFWGILGALVMRAGFIFGGIALLEKFHWMVYVFGALLVFTGIKIAIPKKEDVDVNKSLTMRVLRKVMPVSSGLHGEKFFAVENGKRMATPLFAALLLVETTDLIFAVDSIPAILAITRDPFLVYTSNVFAILGLRSLYFALAGVMQYFRFVNYGLAGVLVFVGTKMLLVDVYKFPAAASLGIIAAFIGASMIASRLLPEKESKHVPYLDAEADPVKELDANDLAR